MTRQAPTPQTRALVLQRAAYHCERCWRPIAREMSLHHRRPRRMGGSKRPDTNQPQNLLVLCGSGTTGCHGWIESHRTQGYEDGIILYDLDDPAEHPYRDAAGNWWLLSPEGDRTRIAPELTTYPRLG